MTLDSFVPSPEQPFVDFVKIDTDGHDVEVLLGPNDCLAVEAPLACRSNFSIMVPSTSMRTRSATSIGVRFSSSEDFSFRELADHGYEKMWS